MGENKPLKNLTLLAFMPVLVIQSYAYHSHSYRCDESDLEIIAMLLLYPRISNSHVLLIIGNRFVKIKQKRLSHKNTLKIMLNGKNSIGGRKTNRDSKMITE